MKKQGFLDTIATEDELTTSPKANETSICFKLDTNAQACVLPENMILSLKEKPQLGKWLDLAYNRSDFSPIEKRRKLSARVKITWKLHNFSEKKKKFFVFLNYLLQKMCC